MQAYNHHNQQLKVAEEVEGYRIEVKCRAYRYLVLRSRKIEESYDRCRTVQLNGGGTSSLCGAPPPKWGFLPLD